MAIALQTIHSFLVYPGKNKGEDKEIRGTSVPASGKLFTMLAGVFDKSDRECTYDIAFNHAASGKQVNPCRTLIIGYLKTPGIPAGRQIAHRLQSVTSGKPGLGLLFLLSGQEDGHHKIVLSRFPADHAIMAEENESSLTVQFLEKVFMKSATSYKAALYLGSSLEGGFWDGKAIDKQINSDVLTISQYWIAGFLESDFRATSAQGSKRLARALLSATKNADDLSAKQEIVAVSRLVAGLDGKLTSIKDVCSRFNLSPAATSAIQEQLPNAAVFTEKFKLSLQEYEKHVAIRAITLNNGAILMAPTDQFDQIFERKVINKQNQTVEYATQGQEVDARLKKMTGPKTREVATGEKAQKKDKIPRKARKKA
jgi:hypothetical protein